MGGILLYFFMVRKYGVMHFICCFMATTSLSLPSEFEFFFLTESTSVKNENFRAWNSSITESALHCSWFFEYWALFGKDIQICVLTTFICTEWHFINSSRSFLKCSFVTSLLTDSCTERKTSSLPHFLLLCFRVCIKATMVVSKSLLTIWELLINRKFQQYLEYCHNFVLSLLQWQLSPVRFICSVCLILNISNK